MSSAGALRNYLGRPLAQQAAIVEALVCLGVARLALWGASFRRLARYLGAEGQETPEQVYDPAASCRLVALAVDAASRHAPWEGRCFAQALAATAMLRRRHLACTTYFGVARDERQQLKAHAWVRCGRQFVTGGAGRERFAVVANFASVPRRRAQRARDRRPATI
jgi:hypothetical protein